ncbi:MAG: hypothetical protein A3G93_10680 [Nitrospinae bacterium RIFCSPLOWO2_12_FULL_45_22]|nr:MAG: hypothetical protein A3G93_10680 [Nitrospinae bacterium RIFCSPLOWO2_12_FULL_45_22]
MDRREFLKLSGLVATGSLLTNCGQGKPTEYLHAYPETPFQVIPGLGQWYASICQQCPAGCGIVVRVVDGRAKKIEGNPLYPLNRGKVCARGQAGLQVLYNPDRIRGPLKLTGRRGSGAYEKISWAEGLKLLADKLRELKDKGEEQGLWFISRLLRGNFAWLVEKFLMLFGSHNYLSYEPFSPDPLIRANAMIFGEEAIPAYDLADINYLLSFSANFLETWLSPVRYGVGYGQMRQGRPGQRGKFIQVEPRLSMTAANADEWIPIKPGYEGILALGLAHIILKEGLYKGQIDNPLAWEEALKEYAPKKVAELTGVSADKIIRVAREFATRGPSLALGGGTAGATTNGVFNLVAINTLNILVGSKIKFPPPSPFSELPPTNRPSPDLSAKAQAGRMTTFVNTMRAGEVKLLMLYDTNPVFTLPEVSGFQKAIEKVPFIVSFGSFMDDTTSLADLILPEHTYLERWGDDVPEPGLDIFLAGIMQPVVNPVFDTRATANVLLGLAKELGGELAEALPWKGYAELLKERWRIIQQSKRGSIQEEDFEEFWSTLLQVGYWWDSYTPAPPPPTAKGKKGKQEAPILPLELPEYGARPEEYPYHLHINPSVAFTEGQGANQPWLQELPDPITTVVWGSWVEINPETARKLGITEGAPVWVESPHGRALVPALIYPGIMPEVVSMPAGQGHTLYGRYAQNRGANPLKILAPLTESRTGAWAWAATRVKLYKAVGEEVRLVKLAGYPRLLWELF